LKGFGENIGIGFQLKDDLLDVYGDQAKFGKQVGGDIIANKKTFLLIQALRVSTGDDRRQLENWLMIKDFDTDQKVEAVKGIYDRNGIRELTDQKMNDYFRLALKQLSELSLPDSRKQTIKDFADYLIAREN
jgi:geranylgeranyl diphosphate synthase, type II